MVRLEVIADRARLNWLIVFQFQCGAIRRISIQSGSINSTWFQFQCGAIRRNGDGRGNISHDGFNSSVVRLEVHPDLSKLFRFQVSIPVWCD